MIYFSQTGSFNNPQPEIINDSNTLIKIQIDNSQGLGWKKEDILLFTNFDYQYGGVKAIVFNNSEFCQKELDLMKRIPVSSKFIFITKLFEKGIIGKNIKETYWLHDPDSFQLAPITEKELALDKYDCGLVNYYPGTTSFTTSSVFFKSDAKDIFLTCINFMYEKEFDDEHAFNWLCESNPKMLERVKSLDWRYTIKRFGFEHILDAIKPIKIAHFRPSWVSGNLSSFDKFVGKNDLHVCLLPEKLINIFANHGIKPDSNNKKL